MKKIKGFTLIELLIVVAIIAILAAIAVPNFLEAQVRSKVSRAHSDMRSLATAIESYMVDNNKFPAACSNYGGGVADMAAVSTADSNNQVLGSFMNCNYGLASAKVKLTNGAGNRCSFAAKIGDSAATAYPAAGTLGLMTLTTPVSFITSYPPDPFADTRGLCFGYVNAADSGWVLWSFGPDCDENVGGQLGEGKGYNTKATDAPNQTTALDKPFGVTGVTFTSWGSNCTYNPYTSNPNSTLLSAGFTYDSTNGSTSSGDVYRTKQ
jgi:prepilin-type N-terminal cleavage/methylation domain-containing protein